MPHAETLRDYLPPASFDYCAELFKKHRFVLTIARPRKTRIGDYSFRPLQGGHHISINSNLNSYSFLVTYLHEIAHLITFQNTKRRVPSHGTIWKKNFKNLLLPILNENIFPPDVLEALMLEAINPRATLGRLSKLRLALKNYDPIAENSNQLLVEQLPENSIFKLGKRIFRKEKTRRTRAFCTEISSGKKYLVTLSASVEPVPNFLEF